MAQEIDSKKLRNRECVVTVRATHFSIFGGPMSNIEYKRDGYLISTDKAKLDLSVIHHYLSQDSYWAQGRSMEIVQKSIDHSLCYGLYADNQQIGFARVVSDYATFAWLADVFILESHRGLGLSKWLVECVVNHPDLHKLRNFLLATKDAHELYRRYGGFEMLEEKGKWMYRPAER
jgi:GNAT superfamily N-acetyltransferase